MTHKKSYIDWDTVPVIMDFAITARLVGLSVVHLKRLAREGKFSPAFKLSPHAWRVRKDALMEWINEQGQKPYA